MLCVIRQSKRKKKTNIEDKTEVQEGDSLGLREAGHQEMASLCPCVFLRAFAHVSMGNTMEVYPLFSGGLRNQEFNSYKGVLPHNFSNRIIQ